MKKNVFLILSSLLIMSCSSNPEAEEFKVEVNQDFLLFSSFQEVVEIPGGENQIIEISPPLTRINFDITNNNTSVITIAAVSYRVTGPDGEVRTGTVTDITEPAGNTIFGTFRPELDENCDGVYDSTVLMTETEVTPCSFDTNNPSFNSDRFYLQDLLSGVDDFEDFRSGSFDFELRFDGWFGTPTDPQEDFQKIISFSVQGNG